MIPLETQAKILRLFTVEHWKVGTIARELGVHHTTVRRVLKRAGLPERERSRRPSLVDPYLPFMQEVLAEHPRLPASRLYVMVKERGYTGGPDHFRHVVAMHRPRKPAEAYLRLKTLPGEQAQVDWAHFGTLTVDGAVRPLMAFVVVLSWSRRIALRFMLAARWRTSSAATSPPSTRSAACPASCSTTTSRARCSSAAAMRSASTRRCCASRRTTATSPAPSRPTAATRRAASSAPSATSARPSGPPAASWT